MRDFLLEIGVEEIPAHQLQPAVEFLTTSFANLMRDTGLNYASLRFGSTPRRFFIIAEEVLETQPDIEVKKTGPARTVAFDENGRLTQAGLGFLRKNNANEQDIRIETSDRGEFIAVHYIQPGRTTSDILANWIVESVPRLPFTKSMIWNESRLALSRPLRWLCVLWGSETLDVEIAGVRSGNISYGNRYLGLDTSIQVTNPGEYLLALKDNSVLADRNERRAKLVTELTAITENSDLKVLPDERLIDTVTDLVEYPTAVMAEFDPDFLNLPDKIITSTISQNQKYFSVTDSTGRLSNQFVFISNGDPTCSDVIRNGNQKVVAARLADAMWYFSEDTRKPLSQYVPMLKDVVFQSKLGSMADKLARISSITSRLCSELKLSPDQTELVMRTAELCKADLVTSMLGEKEFTKLQGYIGKQYALVSGEPSEVAEGIYEHYMPRGNNDGLPQTLCGAAVAVADKLDSVCGIIGIGLVPTGSADPFALRRAANGVVQIVVENGWGLDFSALLDHALAEAAAQTELSPTSRDDVYNFFRQRVEWLLSQLNLDYDVIDSLKHLSLSDLPDFRRRAFALQDYRSKPEFLHLVIGFKRVSNIIAEIPEFATVNDACFTEEQEKVLFTQLGILKSKLDACLSVQNYPESLALLVGYGVHIDRFFDSVLVNCEDQTLRLNRYALLSEIRQQFLRVADISRIVMESDSQ